MSAPRFHHEESGERDASVLSWAAASQTLTAPDGSLNLGTVVDRIDPDLIALHVRHVDGRQEDVSYGELAERSNRIARALQWAGVRPRDRVFLLLDRGPAFHEVILGVLKAGAVVAPLFSGFGPVPVASRIRVGQGGFLITTDALYEHKIAPVRDTLPGLRTVFRVPDLECPPETASSDQGAELVDLAILMAEIGARPTHVATHANDAAWLHFTSGTTGTPKAVMHTHGAGGQILASAREALDLKSADRYWCTADPGWVTGTVYGVIAPMLAGATSVIEAGPFDPAHWIDTLVGAGVSVWYTTPTALRMLIRSWPEATPPPALPELRVVACVGEPLNPEVVEWGRKVLGHAVRDTWWQTETGAIMLAALPGQDTPDGAMGRPLTGVSPHLVQRERGGTLRRLPDVASGEGELAFEAGWPAMFRDYLGQSERYTECFRDGLYLTGDQVRRDIDGHYWFVGRADDMIKSSGHLIGAFEVERVLMAHPAVVEAAAIGVPDETVGEQVRAVVTLHAGVVPTDALATALRAHARARLGAAIAPKEISFAESLPHTRSGKIMRRLVRARLLGLPTDDLSMLQDEPDDHDDDD
jgi:acetyl-CoA synthetase